jgi:hypothetical protein
MHQPVETHTPKHSNIALQQQVPELECVPVILPLLPPLLPQVLFKQARLRNTPFEWVYDGLAPALLPQVLERSKGMPLSLALVAAAVARRLGVRMQLLCAPEGLAASTAQGRQATVWHWSILCKSWCLSVQMCCCCSNACCMF